MSPPPATRRARRLWRTEPDDDPRHREADWGLAHLKGTTPMAAGRYGTHFSSSPRLATVIAVVLALVALPLTIIVNSAPEASAVSSVSNAAIADKALSYVPRPIGQACKDAGNDLPDGECRTFVNCVLKLVTGFNTAFNQSNYFAAFAQYGQRITSANQLVKGDVVQRGINAYSNPHTYIIVSRISGNTFNVVDSNSDLHHRVMGGAGHNRVVNLSDTERAYRLGTVSVSPAPQAGGSSSGNPLGHVDSVTRAPGGLRAQGWVIDPDTSSPIEAHAYSGNGNPGGGNPGAATRADRNRPDVARAYPGKGAAHGFDVTVPARGPGQQTACVYGINVGAGNTNPRIGCGSLDVSQDPYGHLDSVRRVAGGVEARGWAIDPDSDAPIAVHVYGGSGAPGAGNPGTPTTAGQDRPDVGNAYPNYGSRHGFTVFLPTGAQTQTVCAYGINNGPGTNPQIGCQRI